MCVSCTLASTNGLLMRGTHICDTRLDNHAFISPRTHHLCNEGTYRQVYSVRGRLSKYTDTTPRWVEVVNVYVRASL